MTIKSYNLNLKCLGHPLTGNELLKLCRPRKGIIPNVYLIRKTMEKNNLLRRYRHKKCTNLWRNFLVYSSQTGDICQGTRSQVLERIIVGSFFCAFENKEVT